MRRSYFGVLLLLAACQTTSQQLRDPITGNPYPVEKCPGVVKCDAVYCELAGAKAVVEYRPTSRMPLIPGTSRRPMGATDRGSSVSSIIIDAGLSEKDRAETLLHEMYHACAGSWHSRTSEPSR